jgi:hypothetical protein
MKKQKKAEKSFVWRALRTFFWTMIILWPVVGVIAVSFPVDILIYISVIFWLVSATFTLIFSIIYLINHGEKAFAVVSLLLACFIIISAMNFLSS